MEKLVYVLFGEGEQTGSDLRDAFLRHSLPVLRDHDARFIDLNVADGDSAGGMVMHHVQPPVVAMVSFWLENADDRGPCEEALNQVARGIAGYLVVESRPLVHARETGLRAEGVKQVTCITKKADLTWEDFIDIWHNDHRDVAIETQSTVGYVRNVVVRKLTAGSPDWDGIVEEVFPIEALHDPKVFFDARSEEEYEANLARMLASVERFIDSGPIEVTQMSEYYLG